MLEVIAFGPDGGDKSNDHYLFILQPQSNLRAFGWRPPLFIHNNRSPALQTRLLVYAPLSVQNPMQNISQTIILQCKGAAKTFLKSKTFFPYFKISHIIFDQICLRFLL